MHVKLIILGTGPAGLTAAIYAARAGLSPLVLHGPQPGGQLMTTTMVENFPGFKDGVLGPVLMDDMQAQALRFGAQFLTSDAVSCDLGRRPFIIQAADQTITADAIIIACGASPKLLGLPAEKKLMGRGVSVCATCDGFFYKGKKVFVVGGGDAALEEAITLTKFARSVTDIHRRDQFRASKIMIDRARNTAGLDFIFDSVVEDILASEKGTVSGIKVRNLKTGVVQELPADGVFIAIGHNPNTTLFGGQLTVNERGYLDTNGVHTNIEGVFAAGDVHDEKYRQAVVAAGDGCQAALEAQWFLERQPSTATTAALAPADATPTSEASSDGSPAAPAAPQDTEEASADAEDNTPHATVAITAANFEAMVLNSTVPVILDFWAKWCGPCRAIAPKIEALAAEYKGRLVIGKWNVDTDGWERFEVTGIPTLIVFKDGKEIKRLSGQEPLQFLKNEFDDLLGEQVADSEAAKALRAQLDATMSAAMKTLVDARQECWQQIQSKLPPEVVAAEEQTQRPFEEEADKRLADLKARVDKGEVSEDEYQEARYACLDEIEADPAFADAVKARTAAREKFGEAFKPLIPEYKQLLAACEEKYNAEIAVARSAFREALARLKAVPVASPAETSTPSNTGTDDSESGNGWIARFVAWVRSIINYFRKAD